MLVVITSANGFSEFSGATSSEVLTTANVGTDMLSGPITFFANSQSVAAETVFAIEAINDLMQPVFLGEEPYQALSAPLAHEFPLPGASPILIAATRDMFSALDLLNLANARRD